MQPRQIFGAAYLMALHQFNADAIHRCVTHLRMQSSVGYAGRRNNQYLLVEFSSWELVFLSISFGGFFTVAINMSNEDKVRTFLLRSADI